MEQHPSTTLAESLAALRTTAQRAAASARPALEALLIALVLRLLRGLEREALAWSARNVRAAAPHGRLLTSAHAARRASLRRRQARLRRARLRRRRRIIARLGYILRCLPGLGMAPAAPAPPPHAPSPPARPPPPSAAAPGKPSPLGGLSREADQGLGEG